MRVLRDDLHPTRFLKHHAFAKSLVQDVSRRFPRGLMTMAMFQTIMGRVHAAYKADLEHLPISQRPTTADVLTGVAGDIGHIAAFAAQGRNSFLIAPDLISLLDRTDLGDVRMDDLQLPFSAFYMSFGTALKMGLPGPPNVIDGMYVEQLPAGGAVPDGGITFYVTTRRVDGLHRGAAGWIVGHEPHFFGTLRNNAGDTVGECLETAIANGDIPLEPDPEAVARLHRRIAEAQEEGFAVVLPNKSGHEREAEFNKAAMPTIRHVLALAVNALCYLTAAWKAEDTPPEWPDDAPATLVQQAADPGKGKRRAAVARLLDEGYLPVRVLRVEEMAHQHKGDTQASEYRDRAVPSHWRRGHWRRQPFGTGREQRRLTWISPTLVRGDRGEPEGGRVYLVDAPRQTGA